MGADIIDVGANSTRPGADILSEQDELERLKQILPVLQGKLTVPLSIDTFYPLCAEYALQHGACIINDVSGKIQPDLCVLAVRYHAGLIAVHNPAGVHGASVVSEDPDIVSGVRQFFEQCLQSCSALGLPGESICFDPGIGFSKNQEQNLLLIRHFRQLKPHPDVCMLCAASRKRFIGSLSGENDPEQRDPGTVAAHTLAIANGADIIRVHNVHAGIQTARIADALCR